MPIDLNAAEQFIYADARLLDRHRLATLLHGAPSAPVLDALRAYRNPDGGFGHALEPDVRGPESEPVSTLHAFGVLAEVSALDDPMVADAAAWIASIADPDGGIPAVMPAAAAFPHAPWMVPSDGGSIVTFALAASLWEARAELPPPTPLGRPLQPGELRPGLPSDFWKIPSPRPPSLGQCQST